MRQYTTLIAAGLALTLLGCHSGHSSPSEPEAQAEERTHGWPYDDKERLVEGYRVNFEKWTAEIDARQDELPKQEVEEFREAAGRAEKQMELALNATPENWVPIRNELARQFYHLHLRFNDIMPGRTPRVPLEDVVDSE